MQSVWQVLLNLIRGRMSGGIDKTIALTVAAAAFIIVFTMMYILAKGVSLPADSATDSPPK